jgi:RelA/SpoT family protein
MTSGIAVGGPSFGKDIENVAWAEPKFSRADVDAAGNTLREFMSRSDAVPAGLDHALEVINNWRSAHSFPLNSLQVGLRDNAHAVFRDALIAQRIKRLASIALKLHRLKRLQLTGIQDIGGCRAVLSSVSHVRRLDERYRKSRSKHVLVRRKDFIGEPKESGYRGIHLIYCYHSDRKTTYNGLQIEMQLRSRIQHAWATAVETVGTFLQESLKSSEGSEDWLRFFAVTGSAFALMERSPTVPGTPAQKSVLRDWITEAVQRLQVEKKLTAYAKALTIIQGPRHTGAYYFLLALDPAAESLNVTSYAITEFNRASAEYLEAEKKLKDVPGGQAVLVSATSVEGLRRAYPNYYLDTELFRAYLDQVIKRS